MAATSERGPVTVRSMLPILGASTIGTAIEWYDFFLYGFLAATVFPKLFFPELDPVAGTIAAFTTNFVGFLARPIGGAFFGWFGDRVGRKSTLIATLLLMGIATTLMGLLPGYAQIGLAAPLLLSILRFLQGAGVGGEWGGSVLLSMEFGDDRRRGFWTSWPQTGVPVGLALSALAVLAFQALFPGTAFFTIGWRIPFLLSAVLIVVGLYIRLRILETPAFRRVKQEGRVSHIPVLEVFRHYWREIILSALLRSAEQAPFYIFTTFLLAYGVKTLKLSTNLLYAGLVITAIISFVMMPTYSAISDRVGRKRWYMIGCVLVVWTSSGADLRAFRDPAPLQRRIARISTRLHYRRRPCSHHRNLPGGELQNHHWSYRTILHVDRLLHYLYGGRLIHLYCPPAGVFGKGGRSRCDRGRSCCGWL